MVCLLPSDKFAGHPYSQDNPLLAVNPSRNDRHQNMEGGRSNNALDLGSLCSLELKHVVFRYPLIQLILAILSEARYSVTFPVLPVIPIFPAAALKEAFSTGRKKASHKYLPERAGFLDTGQSPVDSCQSHFADFSPLLYFAFLAFLPDSDLDSHCFSAFLDLSISTLFFLRRLQRTCPWQGKPNRNQSVRRTRNKHNRDFL